jgi:hypothetical protein
MSNAEYGYIKLHTYDGAMVVVEEDFFLKMLEDTFQTNADDFMSDYTFDDAEEIINQAWAGGEVAAFKILGYVKEPVPEGYDIVSDAARVSVVLDDNNERLTFYTPIGQHAEADRGYYDTTTPITKEAYLKASKGYYTPAEYL